MCSRVVQLLQKASDLGSILTSSESEVFGFFFFGGGGVFENIPSNCVYVTQLNHMEPRRCTYLNEGNSSSFIQYGTYYLQATWSHQIRWAYCTLNRALTTLFLIHEMILLSFFGFVVLFLSLLHFLICCCLFALFF